MNEMVVLVAAGIITWSLRASAVVLVSGHTMPQGVTHACGYARHAVLSALVATAVTGGASTVWGVVSPQLVGVIAASAVAWRTGSVLRTLVAGVGAVALAAAVWP